MKKEEKAQRQAQATELQNLSYNRAAEIAGLVSISREELKAEGEEIKAGKG